MRISGVSNNIYCYKTNRSKLNCGDKFEVKNMNMETNNQTDIYGKLKQKYDIRNATFDEVKEIAEKLHEAGEISEFQYANLILDRSRISVPEHEKKFLIDRYHGGRQDWIEIYEDQAKTCLSYGDMNSYNKNIDIIKALKKCEQ
ncbi:hypothetical protein [Inediibacterium massiliense]|uniref:hypothetical protein n=1 Tax=Inediibacterium massiliense TaxID=1658111 RepID=UPI0006B4A93F|nr:hypothetical protein [Inediibacterium massiliense]